jgi:inorganic triphosphatase YgiF
MPVEVEAKFRADDPAPLEALAAMSTLADASLGPPRGVVEIDAYLDTVDGRLADARWACRLRNRDGALRLSLKGPAEPGGGGLIHRRPEVEGPASAILDPTQWPPSEARDLLARLSGGEPLLERFRLRQRRTERGVLVDDRPIGTLSLDDVTVLRDGRMEAGRLFTVELELLPAADPSATDDLERLAAALDARPGLVPDPRTKLEHALELLSSA